mgnify:CR=1 FL=1
MVTPLHAKRHEVALARQPVTPSEGATCLGIFFFFLGNYNLQHAFGLSTHFIYLFLLYIQLKKHMLIPSQFIFFLFS